MNTFFIRSNDGAAMASRFGILSKGSRNFYSHYPSSDGWGNKILASQDGWLIDTPLNRGDFDRLGIKVSSPWWDGTWAY